MAAQEGQATYGASTAGAGEHGSASAGSGVRGPLSGVAAGMSSAAAQVRARCAQEGRLSGVAERVADTLERGSQYLHDREVPELAEDLVGAVKRNPVRAIWIGLGAGFLLGRLMRQRRA